MTKNSLDSPIDSQDKNTQLPAKLQAVIDAWPILPDQLKAAILTMLGTAYTMEQNFYRDILTKKYGLKVVVPAKREREYINVVIFDELCAGKINEKSKEQFVLIIERLRSEAVQNNKELI